LATSTTSPELMGPAAARNTTPQKLLDEESQKLLNSLK
jgi:hypothetical protein